MTSRGPEQRQPTNGQRPENPRAARGRAIAEIFDRKWDELVSLFPKDGQTFASRARAQAIQLSRTFADKVTPESIAEAALGCMSLGLDIGSHAYVYPYGDQAKLTIGPQGLITLAFRGGFTRSVVARCVFEGDDFDYNLGDNTLRHKKLLGTEDGPVRRPWAGDGNDARPVSPERLITYAYAIIDTTTEGRTLEVLTWEDIAFYRSFSKATSKDTPWFNNFEGMARKTALKRALAFVPQSPMLAAALREHEDGTFQVPEELLVAARSKAGLDVLADVLPQQGESPADEGNAAPPGTRAA